MYKELTSFCTDNTIILVAVSKTRSNAAILDLYQKGQRIFGENRVQELKQKFETLPQDIDWHMIGHLQSNKVKQIAPFVKLIHSGSSLSLLKEINKQARNNDRIIDVLLQIKIGKEEAKSGWDKSELLEQFENQNISSLNHIQFRGVMGMATFTSDEEIVRSEFSELKSTFDQLSESYFNDQKSFDTVSMGMSGDYKIAAEEGATMVRIGSLLFQ